MRWRTAGMVAALLVAAAPQARAQGPAEMPRPAAEMAGLDFFEGKWTCSGEAKPGPFGPGGATTSTADIQNALGGFWQSGRIHAAMPNLPPMDGQFYSTWDPAAGGYLMLWVDNTGAWSQSRSKGWEGDTLVYEGEMSMGGQKMMGRDSFTKGADGSMTHRADMQVDAKWVPMFEEVCRKGS